VKFITYFISHYNVIFDYLILQLFIEKYVIM